MSKKRKAVTAVLLCILSLTLTVIFAHSAMSPSASIAESGAVRDFFERLLPSGIPLREFILDNIRKIAHFVEFGVLGAEMLLVMLASGLYRARRLSFSFGFGALAAFLDESIQILSRRGASVLDIWIDISGYVSVTLLLALIYHIVLLFQDKNRIKCKQK